MIRNVQLLWISLAIHVRNALLNILHDQAYDGLPTDEKTIYERITNEKYSNTLNRLKRIKVLKSDQWELLFPANRQTSTAKWDITLICVIIRNLLKVSPPDGGWHGSPSTNDTAIGAWILRAYQLRNMVMHFGHVEISNTEFELHWKSIERVLKGLSYDKINEFNKLLIIKNDNEAAGWEQSLENKTNFPNIATKYKKNCDKFISMYNHQRENFKNLDGLGYFYNEEIREGTGSSGEIFLGLAVCLGKGGVGKWVAIKRRILLNKIEINILDNINAGVCLKGHKNILDLLYSTSDDNFYYTITPLYNYTLEEYLENTEVTFEKKVELGNQLMNAVEYLHSSPLRLLHRNLQPSNIMIQLLDDKKDGEIVLKLIGFGSSSQHRNGFTTLTINDSIWLPPVIISDVTKLFTDTHECFVLMMLLVYILSGGEHPFVNSEDDLDKKEQLKKVYAQENSKMRDKILIHNDLQEFFESTFDMFFKHFQSVNRSFISSNLTVKSLIEAFRKLYILRSPNHTSGYRYLALLPFTNERVLKDDLREKEGKKLFKRSKKLDDSKLIHSGRQNSSTLRNCFVNHCDFKTIQTVEDMCYEDFIKKLQDISVRCYVKKPIFLFVYILAHANYDNTAEDDCFALTAKGEKDCYLKDLLNDINSCFEYKDLKVCLFMEGCRTPIKSSKNNEASYPENTVVFNSVKKGRTSKCFSDNSKFCTAGYFCSSLGKYIEPGKNLKEIIDEVTEDLSYIYILTTDGGEDIIQSKIRDDETEDPKKQFLTPQLSHRNKELMTFVF